MDPLVAQFLELSREIERLFPELFVRYLPGQGAHFLSVRASLLSPYLVMLPDGDMPCYAYAHRGPSTEKAADVIGNASGAR